MARTKTTSTNGSASKSKVAKISGEVGKSNQTVAAIKERYKLDEEKQKANFAKATEDKVFRKTRDVTRNAQTPTLSNTDREKIKAWLSGNIYTNSANLIKASRYLYYRSPIYAKMIELYVAMYCLDCRMVTPNYDFTKDMDSTKSKKQFEETLKVLDNMNLQGNFQGPLKNMWLQDVSFNLYFHDDYGSFFWYIDPSEAIIDGYYNADGGFCYSMALDMSKWKSAYKQDLINFIGSPLKEMWAEYERTGIKFIHVPAEYSCVLKFRTDMMDVIIPPLIYYLIQLAGLNDLSDIQADADDLSFYKMIYLPLSTLSGAKNSDDWKISPDLAIDYFKIAADTAIPSGISSAVIPGDELKTIDFSDSVTESVNRVENSQQQILGSAGGAGALLNATKAVNNTALINAALKSESHYVLNSVLPQIQAFANLQISLIVSDHCHLNLLPVTIYTKDDYRKSLLEANQYSFSSRLCYGTLLGFTERQTMAQLKFETEVLGLQNLMQYPLSSSFTSSGKEEIGQVGQGRPLSDPETLSPSGERSRNK